MYVLQRTLQLTQANERELPVVVQRAEEGLQRLRQEEQDLHGRIAEHSRLCKEVQQLCLLLGDHSLPLFAYALCATVLMHVRHSLT